MLLYEHPLSSYAQKVKIALREKGLAFDLETPQALGSGNSTGPFAAASPRLEVPTLVDGEARIFDSTIILEYLEDKHPSPALLPRDPLARAEARMIEEVCDTLYEAINWGLGEIRWFKRAEGRLADDMKAKAASQTRELLEWLTGKLGTARNGSAARASAGPISASRPISIARCTTASARRRTRRSRRWHKRMSARVHRSPRRSRSSTPRRQAWAMPPSASRQARCGASIAIIVWNG